MVAQEYMNQQNQMVESMIQSQFDTSEFLNNINDILIGLHYDSQSGQRQIKPEYAYLNHIGAAQIINEIKGRIQNINASGNLKKKEIAMIRLDIWVAICKKLLTNHEKYELMPENTSNILYLVDHNLLTFLSRSEEGGFFKKLSDFFTRKETNVSTYQMQAEEQQKKRRFSL